MFIATSASDKRDLKSLSWEYGIQLPFRLVVVLIKTLGLPSTVANFPSKCFVSISSTSFLGIFGFLSIVTLKLMALMLLFVSIKPLDLSKSPNFELI